MAIGRVSGEMLLPNLERDGVDLAIETDLLYFDVTNRRIGLRASLAPVYFTGTLTGTALTVTVPPTSSSISVGMTISGTGVTADTKIVSGSGTAWVVNKSSTATGSFTGQFAPNFNFVVNSNTRITDTTDSTSCDTGALVVDGGVGIAKNLNVCGDIFVGGVKVVANPGGAKRKLYSFNVPSLAVGAVYYHTAALGYANIVYNISVIAPVKIEVHSTPAYDDDNPYTFLPTTLHQTDDGTIYFTDGTRMRTRQYSILANLEVPPTKNVYFKITGIGDVFGGTPLSDLAPASFTGSISGTTLTIVGPITGRLFKGMTITGTGGISVAAGTTLTQFLGSSWTLNFNYTIGTAASPVVMTARYYVAPSPPLSVTFYGYITGTTLTITSGLTTSLVLNMTLSSTDPTVTLFSNTRILSADASIWQVSQTQSVGSTTMEAQILTNTLSMIYIDEVSDSGSLSVNVVSVLPATGYVGETVYRSTDKTYWVYSGSIWNQIK